MPFPATITDYTKLRGDASVQPTWRGQQLLVLGSNTTVFAARVNGTPTDNSFAQISYDTVSVGAYTDIEVGMTVLISATDDKQAAYFVGRVRAAPTSSVLYINETSAAIQNDHYIFVIRDWRVQEKLARVSGGTYYKDWNRAFSAPAPLVYGLQSAYVGVVSGTPPGYTVSFEAQALAVAGGASISGYAWTFPSGATIVGGSATSANVTVRFDASNTEYWVKLVVADSGGRTATRRIPVWALSQDLSGASLAVSGASISASIESGWSVSFTAYDRLPNVLDNTLAVLFTIERYNGDEGALVTNINAVGRLRSDNTRSEADEVYSRLAYTTFEVETPDQQLARLAAPLIKIRHDTTPTVWDEINKLTIWRAVCHLLETHTTYLETNSLSFTDTSDTFVYDALTTQGQSVLDAVRDFLDSVNMVIEWAASGEARIARDARYLTSAERDALDTIAAWDERDYIELQADRAHRDRVGQIKAFGGSYNSSTDKVVVVASFWPGQAQGDAEGRLMINGQVLAADLTKAAAQSELNRRTGHRAAIENTRLRLRVVHPDGYHLLVPSVNCWYTWDVDADEARREIDTTTRWLLTSVTTEHDNETGTRKVDAEYVPEVAASPGRTYNPPPIEAPTLPNFPPQNVYPTFPDLPSLLPPSVGAGYVPPLLPISPTAPDDAVPSDGNTVLIWTENNVYWTDSFLTTPVWRDVTPDDLLGTVRACTLGFGRDAYVLASDGSSSVVYYTNDVFVAEPEWAVSTSYAGEYTVIRQSPTQGTVFIYGRAATGGSWSQTFDFTTGDGGFSAYVNSYGSYATYIAGSGWRANYFGPPNFTSQAQVVIERSFSATTYTRIKVTFDGSATGSLYGIYAIYYDALGNALHTVSGYNIRNGGAYSVEWTGSVTTTKILFGNGETGTTSTDLYITAAEFEGTGTNPFGGSTGGVEVRVSTDYGASFSSPLAVGSYVAGSTGFDAIRIGTQSLAGRDGQVELATTIGGAYSDYGSALPSGALATAIHIPRYQFASTTASNAATNTPQYLLASSSLTSSNEALWRVTNNGTTFTNITPVVGSDYGKAIGSNCITMPWRRGDYILAVLTFGSTPRLVVSTNSGNSWANLGVLSTNANYIRTRKGDANHRQAFLTNNGPAYIPDYRAASPVIYTRAYPSSDPVIGIEVYG